MKKPDRKKIIIAVTAAVLVVAIGLGIWFGVSRGKSEAAVRLAEPIIQMMLLNAEAAKRLYQ